MRKQGGSLFYEPPAGNNPATGKPWELTGAMSRYNRNIATLIAGLAVGTGFGGLAAFSKWKRRPSVLGLAGVPSASTNAPLGISFLKRKLTRRKPEEEEEKEGSYKKTAETPGYPGWKPGDAGILGSDMSDMVLYPSLVALLSGGWYGGNLLGDYLSNKRRKRDREDALSNAKYDYEKALQQQLHRVRL
jgi:hypothetical protein